VAARITVMTNHNRTFNGVVDAEQFRIGIADGDFHREALRDVDPVNAFLDQRQAGM
jgi:hypothetical protein